MSLSVQSINKFYGDVQALTDIDLSLAQGELAALVGPSGCGKTTLLRSIAGLEQPSSGQITIGDNVVFARSDTDNIQRSTQQRQLGMVFQDFALWPHLTVFENVAFGLRARKQTKNLQQRVNAALDQVQLTTYAKRYPSQLSGGQQQRVSIARAIVTQPKLILLDEPLSALDAVLKEQIQQLLVSVLKENQLTAVYVTHDQSEAMSIADKVMLLNQGRVEQFATPEVIYRQPESAFVATFIGKNNRLSANHTSPADKHISPAGKHSGLIDNNTPSFVRMENLRSHPSAEGNDLRFEAVVTASRFHGQHYLIEADMNGESWYFSAEQPITRGRRVALFCSPKDVYSIPS